MKEVNVREGHERNLGAVAPFSVHERIRKSIRIHRNSEPKGCSLSRFNDCDEVERLQGLQRGTG